VKAAARHDPSIAPCGHRIPGSIQFRGRRTWAKDPLTNLSLRIAAAKNLNDRDRFHVQRMLRDYARRDLTQEQRVVIAAGLFSYAQMLRLMAAVDQFTTNTAEYRRSSSAFIRYANNFKRTFQIAAIAGRTKAKTQNGKSMWEKAPMSPVEDAADGDAST
jgi:hypothetical protein